MKAAAYGRGKRMIQGINGVGKWLSLVEHSVRDAGVGGSNPLFPTIKIKKGFQIVNLESLSFFHGRKAI